MNVKSKFSVLICETSRIVGYQRPLWGILSLRFWTSVLDRELHGQTVENAMINIPRLRVYWEVILADCIMCLAPREASQSNLRCSVSSPAQTDQQGRRLAAPRHSWLNRLHAWNVRQACDDTSAGRERKGGRDIPSILIQANRACVCLCRLYRLHKALDLECAAGVQEHLVSVI